MKRILTLTALSVIILSACKKETITSSQINSESQANASGSGSGGDDGGNTTTGLLQNVLSGTSSRLIAGYGQHLGFVYPTCTCRWLDTQSYVL